MVVCKVIVPFVIIKYELDHCVWCYSKYLCLTYLLGFIFFSYFCKYVKWGSGEKWAHLAISQGKSVNSEGILILVLGMNPAGISQTLEKILEVLQFRKSSSCSHYVIKSPCPTKIVCNLTFSRNVKRWVQKMKFWSEVMKMIVFHTSTNSRGFSNLVCHKVFSYLHLFEHQRLLML